MRRTPSAEGRAARVPSSFALLLLVTLIAGGMSPTLSLAETGAPYRVEEVATPPGIAPEVTSIAFTRDGDLVAAFRLGTVWIRDRDTREWRLFASGLYLPLGILPGPDGELLIAQVPELTRVVDSDRDGEADLYETIADGWGLSGNYHEFIAGPVRDAEGHLYVALGCASSGGPVRPPVRGELRAGPREEKVYGHFSPVPWRGWVVRIEKDGSVTPFASGFRQPHGLFLGPEGELFVCDNQGDWVGTSPIHHVTRGAFHGHPASLVWDESLRGLLQDLSREELDDRRKPPAIRIPQNDLAGSIAQAAVDTTDGRFGPYRGQLFVSEWSHARVHRVFLETIDGVVQGAVFPFLEGGDLRRGSHRLAFAPDGSLYLGQISRLWGGTGEGIQRIEWTGEMPFDILEMRLEDDGFALRFTRPVDESSASERAAWAMRQYDYAYHAAYGSPKIDEKLIDVRKVTVSKDGLEVRLGVELAAGRVFELRPHGIRSRDGAALATRMAAYTVNRLRSREGGSADGARRDGAPEQRVESSER